MEVLTLNGKTYVKASKAARDLGYTSDYVGQLCRGGSVDAHLVGRTWYVNPEVLSIHRVEKKRNARIKAREQVKRSLEESKKIKVVETTNVFKNIGIRYKNDEHELVPKVHKVPIVSSSYTEEKGPDQMQQSGSGYSIENQNKKVLMSGKIPVYDAELEPQVTDEIRLTARITRKPRPKDRATPLEVKTASTFEESTETIISSDIPVTSFEEKLLEYAESAEKGQEIGPMTETEAPKPSSMSSFSFTLVMTIAVCLTLASIASPFCRQRVEVANGVAQTSFEVDFTDIQILYSKI